VCKKYVKADGIPLTPPSPPEGEGWGEGKNQERGMIRRGRGQEGRKQNRRAENEAIQSAEEERES
jgi:hypothetical protein